MSLVEATEWLPPDRPDPVRRDRLRFLAGFLNDRAAAPDATDEAGRYHVWSGTEVRDYAAGRLAGLLRLPVYRESSLSVMVDRVAGPLSRFILREAVRAAAARELAHPAKP